MLGEKDEVRETEVVKANIVSWVMNEGRVERLNLEQEMMEILCVDTHN